MVTFFIGVCPLLSLSEKACKSEKRLIYLSGNLNLYKYGN